MTRATPFASSIAAAGTPNSSAAICFNFTPILRAPSITALVTNAAKQFE